MSWDRPDQEPGQPAPNEKPFCTTRPIPYDPLADGDQILKEYMKWRGMRLSTAVRNHWYVSRDAGDSYPRVVIPATSANLGNRFWQARLITDIPGQYQAIDAVKTPPKYQSPAGCQRGDAVVVVRPKGDPSGTCLVEGPFDALAAAAVGYLGIAWMGKAPGAGPIALALRLSVEPIYVIADSDAIDAAVNVWCHFPGAFMVNPYPYKDLAEMDEQERKVFLGRW